MCIQLLGQIQYAVFAMPLKVMWWLGDGDIEGANEGHMFLMDRSHVFHVPHLTAFALPWVTLKDNVTVPYIYSMNCVLETV